MASPNSTTTPSRAELQAISYSAQGFTPSSEEQSQAQRHQPAFLYLAPTTSASYPVSPLLKSSQSPKQVTASSPNPSPSGVVPALPLDAEEAMKTRRSSSLGSDGSVKKRFLKLGPVHFGEGDGKGDWSEEVITE